jgi:hypothetical protein
VASSTAAVGGTPPPPDPVGSASNPAQSLKDGCQRNPLGLLSRNSPEWTYVYNANSDPGGPPPAPQWVTGTVSSFEPRSPAVHTSGGDLPPGHSAYDYNVNILPDTAYQFLLAGDPTRKTGNYAGSGEETNRLHTEWEDLSVPKFAWVEPGDRLTERGSWVWDCGHWGTPSEIFPPGPDYVLPDIGIVDLSTRCLTGLDPPQCKNVTGEATEFHPYRAFWDVRHQSPNSPFAENEAALYVSTDKTPAGKEADCAHRNPPVPFGPSNPDYLSYPPAYRACLETEPNWQDVSGHYSFFLAAPPPPSPNVRLVFRATNHGSTSNAPRPTLTQEGNGVRVSFDLFTDSATKPQLQMGYSVFVGWSQVPLSAVPTHLRVTLDKLEIHRSMDSTDCRTTNTNCAVESTRHNQQGPCVAPPCTGQWNLYWDVGGVWGQWGRSDSDPPAQGELDVKDGDVLAGSQAVDLYVPPGAGWRFFVHGRECDLGQLGATHGGTGDLADCPNNHDLADDNDVTGLILDQFASAQASLGIHRSNGLTAAADPHSTCPDVNPEGCYSVTYTVTEINDKGSRVSPPGADCHPGDGDGQEQGKGASPAHFHFDGDACEDGDNNTVTHQDPNTGTDFHSTQIQSMAFDDSRHSVTITGVGLDNANPVSFVMVAVDGGALPLDLYSITLSNGYNLSGTPLLGSIQLQ